MIALLRRIMCAAGIHAWGIYSWFDVNTLHPGKGFAILMCGDCHKREWVYEGE